MPLSRCDSAYAMWIIGDLQGCHADLNVLLARLPAHEQLLFLGDIVNRGPQSLATLRQVRSLEDRAITVLGNHDLHLLAVAAGVRKLHDDDTLREILQAPDCPQLLDWLRQRPLAHAEGASLFVHAGVLPPWTQAQTLALAREVEAGLQSDNWQQFLATMYGNEPARWDNSLQGAARSRCVINALTRLRYVRADGSMDLKRKDAPAAQTDATVMPWFDHPQRATRDVTVVFGHWSALGWMNRADAVCLDSGCVWGGHLSALQWPERQLVQVKCSQWRALLPPEAPAH